MAVPRCCRCVLSFGVWALLHRGVLARRARCDLPRCGPGSSVFGECGLPVRRFALGENDLLTKALR